MRYSVVALRQDSKSVGVARSNSVQDCTTSLLSQKWKYVLKMGHYYISFCAGDGKQKGFCCIPNSYIDFFVSFAFITFIGLVMFQTSSYVFIARMHRFLGLTPQVNIHIMLLQPRLIHWEVSSSRGKDTEYYSFSVLEQKKKSAVLNTVFKVP